MSTASTVPPGAGSGTPDSQAQSEPTAAKPPPADTSGERSVVTDAQEGDDGVLPSPAPLGWARTEVCLAILTVFAVFYTLYAAKAVMLPLAIAFVLALLLRPVVRRMRRRGVPESVGAGLVLATVILGGAGLALQLAQPAASWLQGMPDHLVVVEEKFRSLRQPFARISAASAKVEDLAAASDNPADQALEVEIQQPRLTNLVLSTTGSFLTSTFIVIVLLYFLLALGDHFLNNVVSVMPTFRTKRDVVALVYNVERGVSSYLLTVTMVNIGLGMVIALAMWLLKMPTPLLWGLMATIFNFIPYLGAVVGGAVVFTAGVVAFDSLAAAFGVAAVYLTITSIEGNFVTPAILGRSMELNPILVVTSLVFWGWMWGVGGALLAVPLLAILKLVCDQFDSTRNLGTLIG